MAEKAYATSDVELVGAQLAIHPVLALLALQDDGAPEAEGQIRDCAEKILAALDAAGWLSPAVKTEDWEDGYATGCQMSHSVGCDAVEGERDALRAEVERLHKLLTSPTSGSHDITGHYQVEPHVLTTRYQVEPTAPKDSEAGDAH